MRFTYPWGGAGGGGCFRGVPDRQGIGMWVHSQNMARAKKRDFGSKVTRINRDSGLGVRSSGFGVRDSGFGVRGSGY